MARCRDGRTCGQHGPVYGVPREGLRARTARTPEAGLACDGATFAGRTARKLEAGLRGR
jgi:hypothetical protein